MLLYCVAVYENYRSEVDSVAFAFVLQFVFKRQVQD